MGFLKEIIALTRYHNILRRPKFFFFFFSFVPRTKVIAQVGYLSRLNHYHGLFPGYAPVSVCLTTEATTIICTAMTFSIWVGYRFGRNIIVCGKFICPTMAYCGLWGSSSDGPPAGLLKSRKASRTLEKFFQYFSESFDDLVCLVDHSLASFISISLSCG